MQINLVLQRDVKASGCSVSTLSLAQLIPSLFFRMHQVRDRDLHTRFLKQVSSLACDSTKLIVKAPLNECRCALRRGSHPTEVPR